MRYEQEKLVRFQHCDPAGIVFYPRYFEMLEEVIEDWRQQRSDIALIGTAGLRLTDAQIEFLRPSRLGDRLHFLLQGAETDGALTVNLSVRSGDEERFRGEFKLRPLQEVNRD